MANELSKLAPQKGERRPRFRVGRGNGSGNAVSYTHLTLPTICSV